MGLFSRRGSGTSWPTPSAADIGGGREAGYAAMEAEFEAQAAEWAGWLTPYVNEGLASIAQGTPRSPRTKRHGGVSYQVLTWSSLVQICFYGYYGGARVQNALARIYEPQGYEVEGGMPCGEKDPGYYDIFIALPG